VTQFVTNGEIAAILYDLAELLEIDGASRFRVNAYRNAALTVTNASHQLAHMLDKNENISKLPNIGRDIAANISEIVRTGELPMLEELEHTMPVELVELSRIPGLGAKRVKTIQDFIGELNARNLFMAARLGRLAELPGIGEKTQAAIKEHYRPSQSD
jgi:DNA polymerase (family 10)